MLLCLKWLSFGWGWGWGRGRGRGRGRHICKTPCPQWVVAGHDVKVLWWQTLMWSDCVLFKEYKSQIWLLCLVQACWKLETDKQAVWQTYVNMLYLIGGWGTKNNKRNINALSDVAGFLSCIWLLIIISSLTENYVIFVYSLQTQCYVLSP